MSNFKSWNSSNRRDSLNAKRKLTNMSIYSIIILFKEKKLKISTTKKRLFYLVIDGLDEEEEDMEEEPAKRSLLEPHSRTISARQKTATRDIPSSPEIDEAETFDHARTKPKIGNQRRSLIDQLFEQSLTVTKPTITAYSLLDSILEPEPDSSSNNASDLSIIDSILEPSSTTPPTVVPKQRKSMLQSILEESPRQELSSPLTSILKKSPTEEEQLMARARSLLKESPKIKQSSRRSLLSSILEDSQPSREPSKSPEINDEIFTTNEPANTRKKVTFSENKKLLELNNNDDNQQRQKHQRHQMLDSLLDMSQQENESPLLAMGLRVKAATLYDEDERHIQSPNLSQRPMSKTLAMAGASAAIKSGRSLLNNLTKAYELDDLLEESQAIEKDELEEQVKPVVASKVSNWSLMSSNLGLGKKSVNVSRNCSSNHIMDEIEEEYASESKYQSRFIDPVSC